MYSILRNLLFCLPAEASHNFALTAMTVSQKLHLSGLLAADTEGLATTKTVMGIEFPHIVGLAAGLDKNADHVDALDALGLGFLELGTLTPRPQPGNPKPRMYRLASEQAIINRMGFNNKGIDHALENIRRRRGKGVLGINIGKNFDTPVDQANDDYLIGLQKSYEFADYITINISSPNTPGLRTLQFGDELNSLLDALKEEQAKLEKEHGRYVPIAVKLAPDLSDAEISSCCASIKGRDIDGLIATNTTLDHSAVAKHRFGSEAGGLSGAPLTDLACEVIAKIRSEIGEGFPIIGVGGIMNGEQAAARLDAGADLLQIYSGFIYSGPGLIRDILIADKAGR